MPKGVYDRKSLEERFEESVDICPTNGCWLWKLRLDKDGYGQISVSCSNKRAHKVAYETFVGPIEDGMICSHLCDSKYPINSKEYRRCCNPEHIVIATPAENSARMTDLGRSKPSAGTFKKGDCVGEKNANSKLTDQHVIEILNKKKEGLKYGELKKLAIQYGISYITIQKYISGALRPELYSQVFPS
jgi:hypothetical protein